MPLDPTIPLGVKQPDIAGNIGQWGQLGLLRNQIQLSNATLQPSIDKARADAATAVTGSRSAATDLDTKHALIAAQQMSGVINSQQFLSDDDPDGAVRALMAAEDRAVQMGVPPERARVAFSQFTNLAYKSPTAARKALMTMQMGARPVGEQQQAQFPAPQQIPTGQTMQPVATGNPALTGVPAGTPQGVPTQMQLPPTTPVMRGNVPGVLGANPEPGFIQTGPALGQAAAVEGRVVPNVKFYADVQAAATAAPQRITQLQEIKSLAPQAVTGDANIKRQVFSKLAGYLGVVFDPTSQTATDELAKAAALLMERSGMGATDAAREVAAMATPNYKMTKEAINSVSNALIGMEKRNLAASAYFSGVPQDSPEFDKRLQTWNNIPARDKAFMVLALPADEKMALANKTRGTQQGKDIAAGIRAIEALGLK